MKKSLLIAAAALAMGTVAVAQDMPAQTPPASPTPDMQAAPPPDSTTPGSSTMQPATPPPADQSGTTAPAPDANSGTGMGTGTGTTPDAAATGAPAPAAGNMAPATQAAGATDTSNYPTCSRTVTDKCVQKGGMAHKHAMHHKK